MKLDMVDLVFYSCLRKADRAMGTPGENIPEYNLQLWKSRIKRSRLYPYKKAITQQHKKNIRYIPSNLREAYPYPIFYTPKEI